MFCICNALKSIVHEYLFSLVRDYAVEKENVNIQIEF